MPAMALMAGVCLFVMTSGKREPKKQPELAPAIKQYASGNKRKDVFINQLLPLIEARNAEIVKTRKQLQTWYGQRENLSAPIMQKIRQLAKEYRLPDFDLGNSQHWETLLSRVDVVPLSLALAQAANESAWGTSRFAREAHNFYGQWCYSKGCGLVPRMRAAGMNHEVAKYASPAASVNSYIRNLNRNPAYKQLRTLRAAMRVEQKSLQGAELAKGLRNYSERGEAYVQDLRALIRHNKLQRLDQI